MVLVIFSCNRQQRQIQQCLNQLGYLHDLVSTYASAQALLSQQYPLIIVEVKGSTSCSEKIANIRAQCKSSCIMAIEPEGILTDGATYLEAGADDHLPQPFNKRVFIARVRAHLRRLNIIEAYVHNYDLATTDVVKVDPFIIDTKYHSVTVKGEQVKLTAREFTLLEHLCRHANQVFSRDQLLSAVWGYNHQGYEHTVNTHMNRLRNKLDAVVSYPQAGQLLETVWGVGYKFNSNLAPRIFASGAALS